MAPKPRKRWDKKAAAKARAAKQPTALEAAADRPPPPPPDPNYAAGWDARQNDEGAYRCPYVTVVDYPKREAWLNGWVDADKAIAPAPAGNKGGTVMRRATTLEAAHE